MKEIFFGAWREGRLKRLQFFGYSILLMFISIAVIMGIIMLVGGFGNIMTNSKSNLFAGMGVITIISFFVFLFVMFVANLNITAKRFRDMGLPGWWSVVTIIFVSWILEMLFPGQSTEMNTQLVENNEVFSAAIEAESTSGSMVANIYSLIVYAVLVFVPSDTFGKKHSVES